MRVGIILLLVAAIGSPAAADDPLPSWNDSPRKQAIVDFVEQVTTKDSPDYVPPAERIAVFDNDGTLWCENPLPFQLLFALDSVKRQVSEDPKLSKKPMVKAALEGDSAKLLADGHRGLLEVIALTHAGMTTEEFGQKVEKWLQTARHPRFDRPYTECVYQPMRELLAYLRAHHFKTYIVSGGGQDFMRVWAEEVYGIPPEQVIGSHSLVKFAMQTDEPVLTKTMDSVYVDDKEGKPPAIHQFIGRRPIFCAGNSDGDKAMLEYTTIANPLPSFGLIVHHTDAQREYAYDANPKSSGKLVAALEDAAKRQWQVVDMERDWKEVLPDQSVTAIDILLEPDQVMMDHAGQVNQRFLKSYPDGFALDAQHRPHITLLQCFVRTEKLPEVYRASGKVLSHFDLQSMRLQAVKHYYIPDGRTGLAGIVIEPTVELLDLQRKLIASMERFMVPTGKSTAFVTTPDDLVMSPALVKYVENFVPDASGERFNPHVTTGVAMREDLDAMLKEPFDEFEFAPASAAVYQLGQYGTAAKRLSVLEEDTE